MEHEGCSPDEGRCAHKPDMVIGEGPFSQQLCIDLNGREKQTLIKMLDDYFSNPETFGDRVQINGEGSSGAQANPLPPLCQPEPEEPETESEDDEPLLDGPQFIHPGDFSLEPTHKFIFRAPFDTRQAKTLKIFNQSESKIAFKIDAFSQGRIELSGTIGLIQPGEFARIEVRTVGFGTVPKKGDRLQVDVMNAPEGELEGSWFWKDGNRTRRSLMVKYIK